MAKASMKIGSQRYYSTPLFRKNNEGRMSPNVLSADYIVGLTDGEGSFCVYLLPPKQAHGSVSYRVQFRYYIKMREDDLPLLQKVRSFWKCGKIYFQKEHRKNQRHNYRFEIFDYVLLGSVVVPFFKKHPLQSKRIKDFELFCQILELAKKKAHHTPKGLRKIKKLKMQMHA